MQVRWIILSSLLLTSVWSCGDDSGSGVTTEAPDASVDVGDEPSSPDSGMGDAPDAGGDDSANVDASTADDVDAGDSGVPEEVDDDPVPILTDEEAIAICKSMTDLVTSDALTEGFCALNETVGESTTEDPDGDAGALTPVAACEACVEQGGAPTSAVAADSCAETIVDCDLTVDATDACVEEAVPKLQALLPTCSAAGNASNPNIILLLTILDGEACTAVVGECPAVGRSLVSAIAAGAP